MIRNLVILLLFPAAVFGAETYLHSEKTNLFVNVKDVIPDIVLDMRYVGNHNFVGKPVEGYEAPVCYLTTRAARALSKVQAELKAKRLSLKVYDCYRPQRGVNHFKRWALDVADILTKEEFYPTINKQLLFKKGFIASKSAHSRGSTVDLTIVPVPTPKQPLFHISRQVPCFSSEERRYEDNTIDMGVGFDCFHELSATLHPKITGVVRRNRLLLKSLMEKYGFKNYSKEWWHYRLINEPYQRSYFDFPVK